MLSHRYLMLYIGVLIVLAVGLRMLPRFAPGVLGYASNINSNDLLTYTNQRRAAAGLVQLTVNNQLNQAAQLKAQNMFANNYWAHISPSGIEPWKWILDSGYDYSYAGENLAKNFSSSSEVVEAWYNSPTHRANLLSDKYQEIGFAVVNGVLDGYETTLVVQMFGKTRVGTVAQVVPQVQEVPQVAVEVIPDVVPKPELATVDVVSGAQIKPLVDVTALSKYVGLVFVGFILLLFGLDIWYSYSKGLRKVTGLTIAHMLFLLFILVTMWSTFRTGLIL